MVACSPSSSLNKSSTFASAAVAPVTPPAVAGCPAGPSTWLGTAMPRAAAAAAGAAAAAAGCAAAAAGAAAAAAGCAAAPAAGSTPAAVAPAATLTAPAAPAGCPICSPSSSSSGGRSGRSSSSLPHQLLPSSSSSLKASVSSSRFFGTSSKQVARPRRSKDRPCEQRGRDEGSRRTVRGSAAASLGWKHTLAGVMHELTGAGVQPAGPNSE